MQDEQLNQLIQAEHDRQTEGLELIPSENYISYDVMSALASVFSNKYAEGYPKHRYYGGQEYSDQIESLAIERAKALFKGDHANVQPHSGAQANEAMYHAWLNPGDTVMAMALDHGGHLTHGHPVTVTARQFNFIRYGLKDAGSGDIDYEAMRADAIKHHPKIIMAGFSSYPRELDYDRFAAIAAEVDSVLVADVAHIAGFIAAGVLANPLDHGFHILTATTHKTLRGPRGGLIISRGKVSSPLKEPPKTVENLPTLIDRTVFPGLQGGPHMNVIAAKAVAFHEAMQPSFKTYAEQMLINAKALSHELISRGCELITGGTDNHLMLIDAVRSFGCDGAEAEAALDKIGLNANKNVIPFDERPAFRPSGLRLGTPAITTRGLTKEHMPAIAEWLVGAIKRKDDSAYLAELKKQVNEFSRQFPLPSDLAKN